MTTSGDNSFPPRLTKIDELTRGDHTFLDASDECLFFGDYSARRGFTHSATNHLILNFKKPVKFRGHPSWRYKAIAINAAAKAFSQNLDSAFSEITLVPVPPSKLKNDPEYDDRIMDMLRALRAPAGKGVDYRELVQQTVPMTAAHSSANRPPPEDWEKVYAIDEKLAEKVPKWIGIIDDLLVTGCRFRAMSNVLKRRFPGTRITGLFIARRVPEAADFSDFFEAIDE
jgi:predicted amidophosphoribosyltransferase